MTHGGAGAGMVERPLRTGGVRRGDRRGDRVASAPDGAALVLRTGAIGTTSPSFTCPSGEVSRDRFPAPRARHLAIASASTSSQSTSWPKESNEPSAEATPAVARADECALAAAGGSSDAAPAAGRRDEVRLLSHASNRMASSVKIPAFRDLTAWRAFIIPSLAWSIASGDGTTFAVLRVTSDHRFESYEMGSSWAA